MTGNGLRPRFLYNAGMENESPLWAKLLRLGTVLAVLGGIAWGILWLEEMRKESAEESRRAQERALKQGREP